MAKAAQRPSRARSAAAIRRRELLAEARALLRHAGARPRGGWLRVYARAVERQHPDSGALVTGFAAALPFLLRFVEPVSAAAPLRRRMNLALRVAEAAGADGARIFYDHAGTGLAMALAKLAWVAACEALLLPIRLVAGLLRRDG
jgi:hypothetical protein